MIHPRYQIVSKADLEVREGFLNVVIKHNLTNGEALYILSCLATEYARGLMVQERHGKRSNKNADEA